MIKAVAVLVPVLVMPEVSKAPKLEVAGDRVVIQRDMGGDASHYAFRIHILKRSRMVVMVGSRCESACTMVLDNPKACALPEAVFGFHQARKYNKQTGEVLEISEDATKILWAHYPEKVRARLGQLTPYMKGTDLLPPCE